MDDGNTDASFVFALACEGPEDCRAVRLLVDRCLVEDPDLHWIDHDSVNSMREWSVEQGPEGYIKWSSSILVAKGYGLRFLRTKSNGPDYVAAASILFLVRRFQRQPDVLFIVRDTDARDPAPIAAVETAISEYSQEVRSSIVMGFPNPKIEAWYLCGFLAETDTERRTLERIRQETGVDVVASSHLCTASANALAVKRNAKQLLKRLTKGSRDRTRQCLLIGIPTLYRNGLMNGLSQFLSHTSSCLRALSSGLPPRLEWW